MSDDSAKCHCGAPAVHTEFSPHMDDYCDRCTMVRCDAYPGACNTNRPDIAAGSRVSMHVTKDEAEMLLAAPRVRVWDLQRNGVFCEGKVIAVCFEPSITVEDDDGMRHHHSLALPVEVERREWISRIAALASPPVLGGSQ